MAGYVNKVILIGNLGKDPEIRRTQDGRPVANLRIATTESWRDKTTRREAREDRVALGGDLQRGAVPRGRAVPEEGRQVYIEGALQTRKWQGQDGQDRYSTEVVLQGFNSVLTMLDSRGAGAGAGARRQPACTRTIRRATARRPTARPAGAAGAGGARASIKQVDDDPVLTSRGSGSDRSLAGDAGQSLC